MNQGSLFARFWKLTFLIYWILQCKAQQHPTEWHVYDAIPAGSYIVNNAGTHFLILQSNGNMCIYKGTSPYNNTGFVKCSRTNAGHGDYSGNVYTEGYFCILNQGNPVWCTGSTNTSSPSYYLTLLDDGSDWVIELGSSTSATCTTTCPSYRTANTVFVDSVFGNDTTAQVESPAFPFATINFAIQSVSSLATITSPSDCFISSWNLCRKCSLVQFCEFVGNVLSGIFTLTSTRK